MRLAQLKRIPAAVTDAARFRGTPAQDAPLAGSARGWRPRRVRYALGVGAALLVLVFAWAVHGWLGSSQVISRERLRFAQVARGDFVRDVAAEGTAGAAVNPTLVAIAPGTVSYPARAGDAVSRGQPLATLDSPELGNEYQRETATLESLDAALARQQIEIRRQILTSQQQAALAQVAIKAAERE